jgi:8-oxo-dGTP pyrophosphatase MutT (NUDIX family)
MIKQFTSTGILVTSATPRKILLGFHNKLQVWLPPGGHIEDEENPTEGLIREILEETGCNIRPYLPKERMLENRVTLLMQPDFMLEELIPARGDKPEHMHLDLNFIVHTPQFSPVYPEREYKDMRWVTKEEFPALPTFQNIREFIFPRVFPR